MRKILVFGGNHHNTLGLIRSVGEKGFPVILILEKCSLHDCDLRYSKYLSKIYYLNDDSEIFDILKLNFWNEKEKPIILCSSDAAICTLDSKYDELHSHFIIFNINSKRDAISFYMNKHNTFPFAKESGLFNIKTWHLKTNDVIPEDIVYPCLTKPANSLNGEKSDMIICHNQQELLDNLKVGIEYIVQEYIEKDYELNVIGVSFDHGKNVIIPAVIRKIRDEIHWQSMYMVLDSFDKYPSLNPNILSKFISLLGYEGLFSIELLCKDDKYYFLEVNMRNDGCGYLYTAAGANLPYLWVKYHIDGNVIPICDEPLCKTPYKLMNEYDIYNVFRYKKITFTKWLYQAFTADTFFILNRNDIKPFFNIIKRLCKKFFNILIH